MQDEFGRPLSDDGQWMWDGSAWRPTAAQAGPGGASGGLDSTMVAPRDYQPTGGQPAQGDYYPSQGGYGPGGPGGPDGPKERVPWYKNQVLMIVLIAVLLVLSAVLVTVLLLTRGGGKDNAAPPSPTTAAPTTEAPTTPPPTTEAPTTPPPTTEAPTSPPPTSVAPDNTVVPGIYDCASGGTQEATVNFQGTGYTTNNGGTGTYQLDPTTGDITFTGADLGDFTGTYDPTGPSMDLTSASGFDLQCAQ
jgi:hypothetical protein